MGIDSLGPRSTPQRRSALLGGMLVEKVTPSVLTMTTGHIALTAAQLFCKLIPLNSTGAGNMTLPTADAIMAYKAGITVGDMFRFIVINYGNDTTTVVINTGITNKTIDSEDALLVVATHISFEFALVCTGVANPSDPSTSNTFDLYAISTSTVTS